MTESMSKPVKVLFKHESDIDGDPIGPMRLVFEDDDPDTSRRYDPDDKGREWVLRSEAQRIADAAGVPLEER